MFAKSYKLLVVVLLASCAPVAKPGTLVISQDDYDRRCVARAPEAAPAPAQRTVLVIDDGDSESYQSSYQVSADMHSPTTERERAVVALAGILLARRSTKLVASTQLCMLEARLGAARAALAREQQVAKVSGVLDEGAAHEAGTEIVELGERISDVRQALSQSLGVAPAVCAGGVREAASCRMNPRICSNWRLHDRAWDAATVVLSGEADVSAHLELRARERVSDEWATEAESRAATLAEELAR